MHDFEDFMRAFYASSTAIRDGHVKEAEVRWTTGDGDSEIVVNLRSEVTQFAPATFVREDEEED